MPPHNLISIILIDDHDLFRQGLKYLLDDEDDLQVIADASNGLDGLELVKQHHPDLVLLDLDMPIMNGVQTLSHILQQQPDLAVLILTVSEEAHCLEEMLQMGAKGYLLKNIEVEYLLESIRNAARHLPVNSANLRKEEDNKPSAQGIECLTQREKEVLKFIAQGVSNKSIAEFLLLSENTVKVHVQSILRKLNLCSRTQAAIVAIEHGMDKPI